MSEHQGPLADGERGRRYEHLMIDPPWPKRKGGLRNVRPMQGRDLAYAVLSLDEIFKLLDDEILPLAADNACVWVWMVDEFLRSAEERMEMRGWARHARIVWDKENGVAPAFTVRYSHEYLVWFYRRGRFPAVAPAMRGRLTTVIRSAAREHSRKPDEAYGYVESLYPSGRRIDVFSRERRAGWDQWGNQCNHFEGAKAVMQMDDQQPGPPQEADSVRRDIEWVRVSQLRFVEGYRARLAEPHPMRKNAKGDALATREPKHAFGEEVGRGRCSGIVTDADANRRLPAHERVIPWPAHEAERWMAGWMHADNICSERGISAARNADPAKVKRPKRAVLAVQEEHSPEFVISKQEARKRKLAAQRPMFTDAGEQR